MKARSLLLLVTVAVVVGWYLLKKPSTLPLTSETESPTKNKVQSNLPTAKPPVGFAEPAPVPGTAPIITPNEKVEAAMEQAQALLDAKQPEHAVALLKTLLDQTPNDPTLLTELGMMQAQVFRNPGEARKYLERAVPQSPENAQVLKELVKIYTDQGDIEGGVAFLQKLAEGHPEMVQPQMALGDLLIAQNRPVEAMRVLETAAAKPGADSNLKHFLGSAQLKAGATAKAEETFTSLLDVAEKDVQEKASRGLPVEEAETNRDLEVLNVVYAKIQAREFPGAMALLDRLRGKGKWDGQIRDLTAEMEKLASAPPATGS